MSFSEIDIGSGGKRGGRSKYYLQDYREIVQNTSCGIVKKPIQVLDVLLESVGINASTQKIRNILESAFRALKKDKKRVF